MTDSDSLLSLATKIATSYLANNKVAREDLPALITSLHETLAKLDGGEAVREPAVPVDKSVKRGEIICLECGRGQKTLKRHLMSGHGLTAEEYRDRWGLGHDYPLVAPNYAQQRSDMAKKIGLGRKPGASPRRKAKGASTS